jgi:ATPase subunit of ABC transporter with duplicated ATPase domains
MRTFCSSAARRHDRAFLEAVCDEVLEMEDGRIARRVAAGRPKPARAKAAAVR